MDSLLLSSIEIEIEINEASSIVFSRLVLTKSWQRNWDVVFMGRHYTSFTPSL